MRHIFYTMLCLVFLMNNLNAQTAAPQGSSRTIVFIHGLFLNGSSWDEWKAFFEARGYTCHTPAYPYHAGNPSQLRQHPDRQLGKVNVKMIVDSMAAFIDKLPEKPILIGHSMGGVIVQKLISQQKGVAGICINSAPPKGLLSLKWTFLKSVTPIINPFRFNAPHLPSVRWFNNSFCNNNTREEAKAIYEEFVVPESRNVARSSLFRQSKVRWRKPHAPLLFIGGGNDKLIPAQLNKRNQRRYKDKNSRSDYKKFEGRSHYICGEKGWEEVATYIYTWLQN